MLAARGRLQPPIVHQRRDEAADRWFEPVGMREKDAALGRNRAIVAEEMAERGDAGSLGVGRARDMRQLLRVAEENEILRARPDRDRIGERELPRLVDQEYVE